MGRGDKGCVGDEWVYFEAVGTLYICTSIFINVEMYSKRESLKKSTVTWLPRHYIYELLCNIINYRETLRVLGVVYCEVAVG